MHKPSLPPAARTWVESGSPAYRRISLALFLAGFATFSLLYCVQPVLPELAEHFSLGAASSSFALSVSTGCLAAAIFIAGALSEGRDKRRLMFASMALAALCNLGAALAPTWGALLAARALEGVLLGGVPAVAMAYLSDEIHPRGLGLSMGPYVGGTAFGGSGFALMGVFVSLFNYAGFRLSAAPYDLSQTQIGLIFCVYLFGIVASPAAGALADRWGVRRCWWAVWGSWSPVSC